MGQHRATQHANAIPRIARSEDLPVDGYGGQVFSTGKRNPLTL